MIALTGWRPVCTWTLLLLGPGGAGRRRRRLHAEGEYGAAIPGGDWIEPLYLLGAVCIGAVAWQAPGAAQIRADTGQNERLAPTYRTRLSSPR